MNIGVLGSGIVGQTLAAGFAAEGHTVTIGTRTASQLSDFTSSHPEIAVEDFAGTAAFADVIVLAVKGRHAQEALELADASNLAGKPVIDATNPIASAPAVDGVIAYFTDHSESLMERLQAAFPDARFVKAFNAVGNQLMIHPQLPGGTPTMFICGNDPSAKDTVRGLLEQVGWDVADYGKAASARAIEPLCMLWCIPGFLGRGWTRSVTMLEG